MSIIYKIFSPFLFARCLEAKKEASKLKRNVDPVHDMELFRTYIAISIMICTIIPVAAINKYLNIRISGIIVILSLAMLGIIASRLLCYYLTKRNFFIYIYRIHDIFIQNKKTVYNNRIFCISLIFAYSSIPFIIMILSFKISRYLGF